MTRVTRDPIQRSKAQTLAVGGEDSGAARLVCFTGTLMSNERSVHNRNANYDLQAESSGWLFTSTTVEGGAYCDSPTTGHTPCYKLNAIPDNSVKSNTKKEIQVKNVYS